MSLKKKSEFLHTARSLQLVSRMFFAKLITSTAIRRLITFLMASKQSVSNLLL